MPAEKKSSGDPLEIHASDWNNMLDAARDYRERKELGDAFDPTIIDIPTDLIKIENNSGGARLEGEILKLNGSLFDVVKPRALWFNGASAETDTPFAVLRKAVRAGNIGVAQVSGVCKARVNLTDTEHKYAAPITGSNVLQSAASGPAHILHIGTTTGEQDAIVLLCCQPDLDDCIPGTGSGSGTAGVSEYTRTNTLCILTGGKRYSITFPFDVCIKESLRYDENGEEKVDETCDESAVEIDACACDDTLTPGTGTGTGEGEGQGSSTLCCDGLISNVLNVTITSAACADINGKEFTMLYNAAETRWEGSVDIGGDTWNWRMNCVGGDPTGWSIENDECDGAFLSSFDASEGSTCDPFFLTFEMSFGVGDPCGACSDQDIYTVNVTE